MNNFNMQIFLAYVVKKIVRNMKTKIIVVIEIMFSNTENIVFLLPNIFNVK